LNPEPSQEEQQAPQQKEPQNQRLSADLFCQVVDNLGDIGVMWRLAKQLTTEKNWQIRLWVDQINCLAKIDPSVDPSATIQTRQCVEIRQWLSPWQPMSQHPNSHSHPHSPPHLHTHPHPIVIAGFSCALPDAYLREFATQTDPVLLQLEYLSAQSWVDSFHGIGSQRSDSLKPIFYFPGFNDNTGGLLREQGLLEQRDLWIKTNQRQAWLASLGVRVPNSNQHNQSNQSNHGNYGNPATKLVSVFTYPHAPLKLLMDQLDQTGEHFHLLLPSDPQHAQQEPVSHWHSERVTYQEIDFLAQPDFDKLLWSCDLNLVRGEDSLMRAIWAAKPLLWQIYPQQDGVHHPKLDAWLEQAQPPESVARAMRDWADGELKTDITTALTGEGWAAWQQTSTAFALKLNQQTDLATKLDTLVRSGSVIPDRL